MQNTVTAGFRLNRLSDKKELVYVPHLLMLAIMRKLSGCGLVFPIQMFPL